LASEFLELALSLNPEAERALSVLQEPTTWIVISYILAYLRSFLSDLEAVLFLRPRFDLTGAGA
jgi:hypothetical protein